MDELDVSGGPGVSVNGVDVLIVAALPEELSAAQEAGASYGVAEWVRRDVDSSVPYLWGEYRGSDGGSWSVALARPVRMGGRVVGPFVASLVDRLTPGCVAMCGVCAGNPAATTLGDVVVAELVYEWDEGKQRASSFLGDHRQLPLAPQWLRAVQEFDPAGLSTFGPASDDEAMLWFLDRLRRGRDPRGHPARERYFPPGTWGARVARYETDGLVGRDPATGAAMLTAAGTAFLRRRLYDEVDGPLALPFQVVTAPMASGSAVVEDGGIWNRLGEMGMRKIAAVEMEAATVATVAHERGTRWLVAKGVMDHADEHKDDRYKRFAAVASAEVLYALLARLIPVAQEVASPKAVRGKPSPTATDHLTALAPVVRALPRDVALFVGREEQLSAMTRKAEQTAGSEGVFAVHGITGMAGVGKTAFAVRAGHALAPLFPDGQFFVNLDGYTQGHRPADPGDVLAALLMADGFPDASIPRSGGPRVVTEARASIWRSRLAGRRVLLILDNAVSADQVRPLLPSAPGTLVITTSRRRIAGPDWEGIEMEVLPPSDALRLFLDLSGREVGRTVGVRDDEAAAAAVTLSGRLPLAITLLAGRLRNHPRWSTQDLVDELRATHHRIDRFKIGGLELTSAFRLSYETLDADRRTFFRRLSLHPSNEFDITGAAAIGLVSVDEARDHIDGLYDDHLLEEPAYGRYRMHDLLRDYARQLAFEDQRTETDRAISSLLTHYQEAAGAADALISNRTGSEGTDVTANRLSLSAALEWMRTEHSCLLACAEYAIRHEMLPSVVALASSLATFLRHVGPWDRAVELQRAAVAATRTLQDPHAEAAALRNLGIALRHTEQNVEAATVLRDAADAYLAIGDRVGQATALSQRALTLTSTRHGFLVAADAHRQALEVYRELGDDAGQISALNYLASTYHLTANYPASAAASAEALELAMRVENRFGEAFALCGQGVVKSVCGELAPAEDLLRRSLEIYEQLEHVQGQAEALHQLGRTHLAAGQLDLATESLDRARSLFKKLGYKRGQGATLNQLARVELGRGELQRALHLVDESLALHQNVGYWLGRAEACNTRGALLSALGEFAAARACHREALRLARGVPSPLEVARAFAGLAQAYSGSGLTGQATKYRGKAVRTYAKIGAAEGLGP